MLDETSPPADDSLRRSLRFVAAANLAYFGVEFAIALEIQSVALFADSIDFLEDASVNVLILMALGWSPRARARIGMLLAVILLIPAAATLWMAWSKFGAPVAPAAVPLSLAGAGALVVNLTCAMVLAKHRHRRGSLAKAAYLSARNDVLANAAIVATGILTLYLPSAWPDLIVGLGIAAINADAAHEVWTAAKTEHKSAAAPP